MKKAKIEIKTIIDDQITAEKYICKLDDNTIEYRDKQKTQTTINYSEDKMKVSRCGFVNYELVHDGSSKCSSEFETLVEGEAFRMELNIQNKYYKLAKYGKILSIEIHFERDDKQLIKQKFNVEVK